MTKKLSLATLVVPSTSIAVSTPDDDENQEPEGEPNDGSPSGDDSSDERALTPVPNDDDEAGPAESIDVQRLVELLPPEDRAKMFAVMRRESMSHSGWLPTPQFMREYNAVLPGLAERIVALPEREQDFRHRTTGDIVRRDYRLRTTGQWMGMAALVLLLLFCAFLAILGGINAAAAVASAVIIGTVGVFVTGQLAGSKSSSKDLIEADEN